MKAPEAAAKARQGKATEAIKRDRQAARPGSQGLATRARSAKPCASRQRKRPAHRQCRWLTDAGHADLSHVDIDLRQVCAGLNCNNAGDGSQGEEPADHSCTWGVEKGRGRPGREGRGVPPTGRGLGGEERAPQRSQSRGKKKVGVRETERRAT